MRLRRGDKSGFGTDGESLVQLVFPSGADKHVVGGLYVAAGQNVAQGAGIQRAQTVTQRQIEAMAIEVAQREHRYFDGFHRPQRRIRWQRVDRFQKLQRFPRQTDAQAVLFGKSVGQLDAGARGDEN